MNQNLNVARAAMTAKRCSLLLFRHNIGRSINIQPELQP